MEVKTATVSSLVKTFFRQKLEIAIRAGGQPWPKIALLQLIRLFYLWNSCRAD